MMCCCFPVYVRFPGYVPRGVARKGVLLSGLPLASWIIITNCYHFRLLIVTAPPCLANCDCDRLPIGILFIDRYRHCHQLIALMVD